MNGVFSEESRVWQSHRPLNLSISGPRVIFLTTVVTEFGLLCDVTGRTNRAYAGQLSLIVGLHFSGALVHVYLFCFHALSKAMPWAAVSIGGARALNNLWRLSVISGTAHYAAKQVCVCVWGWGNQTKNNNFKKKI